MISLRLLLRPLTVHFHRQPATSADAALCFPPDHPHTHVRTLSHSSAVSLTPSLRLLHSSANTDAQSALAAIQTEQSPFVLLGGKDGQRRERTASRRWKRGARVSPEPSLNWTDGCLFIRSQLDVYLEPSGTRRPASLGRRLQ